MANDKISSFPTVAPTYNDFVPIVQGGANKKTTIANFGGLKNRENKNGGPTVVDMTLAIIPPGLLLVFKNGMLLLGDGNDYTVDDNIITFIDPSTTTDIFSAIY